MSSAETDQPRNVWSIAWFGGLLGIGIFLWFWVTKSYIADDSYFYVVIARNIATEGRQTFSNLFLTNGFHPLWGYVLAGYTFLVHAVAPNAMNQVWFAVPLTIAMLVGTAVQCWRFARAIRLDPLVVTSLVVGFYLCLGVMYSEGPLFFLLLTTLLVMMARDPQVAETRPVAFGLLTAAIVLTRLDAIFFVGFVYLYYLWNMGFRPRFLAGGVLCAALVGAYVLSNIVIFGGAMPVSGWLKGNFPHPFWKGFTYYPFPRVQLSSLGGYSVLFGWMPLAVGLVTMLAFPPRDRFQRVIMLLLLCGAATQGAYIAIFTRSHTLWPWYYVLPITLLAVSLGVLVNRWERLYARPIVLGLISVAVIAAFAEKVLQHDSPASLTIDYLAEHGIHNETILVSDWPGAVAYYTDNNVLAADMLTSNRIDFERMRNQSNSLEFLVEEAKRLGKPLREIMIVGNNWLLWDDTKQEIVFYDPRHYPVLVPIGSLPTRITPTGELECGDGIRVWLGPKRCLRHEFEANAAKGDVGASDG